MKFLKIALLFVLVAAYSGLVGATEGTLNTQFWGWVGKNQHGYYLDGSDWHYCFNNKGGSCGTVALTTGHSQCRTTGFNIGGKWAIPTRVGGMEINAGPTIRGRPAIFAVKPSPAAPTRVTGAVR